MSGNYGQSYQGSDDCSIIPTVYLICRQIDLYFIAGYDQSQSNRGDDYGRNKGLGSGGRTKTSQSSGGYGSQGGDTQGYGGGAYGGGDQCIPSFFEILAWNTEMIFIRWRPDPRRV